MRPSNAASGEKETEGDEPQIKLRARLASETEVLRRCMDWLQRLEHSEIVVVNLRPDTEVETEFVSFDRLRVLRVPERIAADLDDLSRLPDDAHAGKESNPQDARARHRHELAPAATRAEEVKFTKSSAGRCEPRSRLPPQRFTNAKPSKLRERK